MRYVVALLSLLALPLFAIQNAYAADVKLTGNLEVKISDGLSGQSKLNYALVNARGRKTQLHFTNAPEGLLTGQRATVTGRQIAAGKVRVGTKPGSFITTDAAHTAAAVSGNKLAVVLRIQSTTSVTSATEAQLASEVSAVALRAKEISFDKIAIINDKDSNGLPDVITVSVATSSAGLTESSAFSLCSQAKQNAGVSGYNHYICILPPDMNYSWYGQAYIGGTDMVIKGQYASGYPNGLLHEIGHNWGSHHANSPSAEYGDSSCIMGGNAGTANRHFNGPQKLGLGWLTATSVTSGTHVIDAIELASGQRLLKVRDPVANQDLYISTRARIGSFSSGPINPGTTQIHTWPGGATQTVLLAALSSGQSFSRNGISISQLSNDGTSSTVSISLQCTPAAPTIQVSPLSVMTNSSTTQTYAVTITNRDSNCAPTVFSLNASASSAALTTEVASPSLTVASGASAATSLFVTPSSALSSGSFTLSIGTIASGHPDATGSATFVYDTAAPNALSTLSGAFAKKRVSLKWSAGTDNGLSGIQDYVVFRNGIEAASTANLTFSETITAGTYNYTVKVRDRAGNLSAASNIAQVVVSSGGGRR